MIAENGEAPKEEQKTEKPPLPQWVINRNLENWLGLDDQLRPLGGTLPPRIDESNRGELVQVIVYNDKKKQLNIENPLKMASKSTYVLM